jgi:hypothetical protein
VSPPIGLDSVGTARWIAQQRAACPGTLRFFVERSSRGRRSDNEMQATQFFYWRNSGSEWPEDEVRDVFQLIAGDLPAPRVHDFQSHIVAPGGGTERPTGESRVTRSARSFAAVTVSDRTIDLSAMSDSRLTTRACTPRS